MTSGGALLVALLSPGPWRDRGYARCCCGRVRLEVRAAPGLHVAKRCGGAGGGPFATHRVRRRSCGLGARSTVDVASSGKRDRRGRVRDRRCRAAAAAVRRPIVRRSGRRSRADHRRDPRSEAGAQTRDRAAADTANGRLPRRSEEPPRPPPTSRRTTAEASRPRSVIRPPPRRRRRASALTSPARRSSGRLPASCRAWRWMRWPRSIGTVRGRPRFSSAHARLALGPRRVERHGVVRARRRQRGRVPAAAALFAVRGPSVRVGTVGRLAATGIDTGAAASIARPSAPRAGGGRQLRHDRRAVAASGPGRDVASRLVRIRHHVFHRASAITTSASLGIGVPLAVTVLRFREAGDLRDPRSQQAAPVFRDESLGQRPRLAVPAEIHKRLDLQRGGFRTEMPGRVLFLVAAQNLQRAAVGALRNGPRAASMKAV